MFYQSMFKAARFMTKFKPGTASSPPVGIQPTILKFGCRCLNSPGKIKFPISPGRPTNAASNLMEGMVA